MTVPRRPVLVAGYDGSPSARAAVRHAADRAGSRGRVVVVHSIDSPSDRLAVGGVLTAVEDRVEHGQAVLDALLMEEAEALADVDFDLELAHGDPARALVDAAREHDADEIVVGTRGGGRVGSLLGSVAHDVLHHADRPVVVIPDRAVRDHPTEGP